MSLNPILSEHSGQPLPFPDISVTPLNHLLPVLSALFPSWLDFINAFLLSRLCFSFWQIVRPPVLPLSCIFSNYIHSLLLQSHPLSFTLAFSTVLHFILCFCHVTNTPPFPSVLICLTFLSSSFYRFVTCLTHTCTTIFSCPAATRNKPSYRSSVQNRNYIVYTSPALTFLFTQRSDSSLCPFLLSPNFLQRASCECKRPTSLRYTWRIVVSGSTAPFPPRPAKTPCTRCCGM